MRCRRCLATRTGHIRPYAHLRAAPSEALIAVPRGRSTLGHPKSGGGKLLHQALRLQRGECPTRLTSRSSARACKRSRRKHRHSSVARSAVRTECRRDSTELIPGAFAMTATAGGSDVRIIGATSPASLRSASSGATYDWETEEVEAVQVRPRRQDAPAHGRPAPDVPDVGPWRTAQSRFCQFCRVSAAPDDGTRPGLFAPLVRDRPGSAGAPAPSRPGPRCGEPLHSCLHHLLSSLMPQPVLESLTQPRPERWCTWRPYSPVSSTKGPGWGPSAREPSPRHAEPLDVHAVALAIPAPDEVEPG
jgi:hypothetical protein